MQQKNNGEASQLVIFRVGREEYGAEISQVREIIRLENITSIPRSPEHVEGVINLRGEITPVISLRSLTGAPKKEADKETRVMIIDAGKSTFGVVVDTVTEVKSISQNMIEELPGALSLSKEATFLKGVAKLPDRMILLIDLKKISIRNLSGKEENINESANDASIEATPASMPVVADRSGTLSEFYIDALRELGNIGASHSATSLSQLIGKQINMSVPHIEVDKLENVPHILSDAKKVAGLFFELCNDNSTSNYVYLLFDEQSAFTITDIMLGQDAGTTKELDDLGRSAIMEVGNILTSSFCDAIAEFLGLTVLPSPPNFVIDMADSIIDPALVQISMIADEVILFRTDLSDEGEHISGYLLLFPNPETLQSILNILDNKAKMAC